MTTITKEQFNSGKGNMPKELFDRVANLRGVDNAIWVAKYYGVSLNIVKSWVKLWMQTNRK